MEYIQFTEFRNHSKEYFDKVEDGAGFVVIRKGRPIAQIIPFKVSLPGWKRDIRRIKLKGNVSTLDFIMNERSKK